MLSIAVALIGCRSPKDVRESNPVPTVASTPEETDRAKPEAGPPPLAPLRAERAIVALPVEGFREAMVSLPLGATSKRPVVVALHGNYDRPEWQCEVWREITGGHPFVLCPRGIPRAGAPKSEDRWEYGGLDKTEKELFAGLEALAKRYPDYVDDGPVLFTGFSLGAILGKHVLKKHGARFPRAVLIEGGYEAWSIGMAKQYAQGGGERVLFACGQHACKQAATNAARVLGKAELDARVASAGNVGHTYDGRVADAISENFDWLIEGDARFER